MSSAYVRSQQIYFVCVYIKFYFHKISFLEFPKEITIKFLPLDQARVGLVWQMLLACFGRCLANDRAVQRVSFVKLDYRAEPLPPAAIHRGLKPAAEMRETRMGALIRL